MIQINANIATMTYIVFDPRSEFSWTDESTEKNVIFGVDNSSSVHVNGRNKNIWVPYEGLTQSLEYAAITAESKYPINFIDSEKRFVLSLHYNTIALYLLIQ